MALSILQSLSKKRLSVSICRLINRGLLLQNQQNVHRVKMDTSFTFADPQKFDQQVRLPLIGVRWRMSSGPWAMAAKKLPPPVKDDMGGDGPHTTVWAAERLTGILLMVLIPLDFIVPSSVFEVVISICAVLHSHWGFDNVYADYCRVIVIGKVLNKVAHIAVYAMSIVTFIGLMQVTFFGHGIAETIKMFWSIKGG